MKRRIVTIDEAACDGCGLCVDACHEGALRIVDGKARLVSDSYCDGLGDCLPACPRDAIKIVEREAAPFDEAAVAARQAGASAPDRAPEPLFREDCCCRGSTGSLPTDYAGLGHNILNDNELRGYERQQQSSRNNSPEAASVPRGCPGMMSRSVAHGPVPRQDEASGRGAEATESRLANWPVQIKLVPAGAPYLKNAALLIAADCCAFALPDIHRRFMAGKVTLIGCPKLDGCDYTEKLTAILQGNDIRSVTVLRMEVPCCAGIARAAREAMIASGTMIPWRVVTIGVDGSIRED